MSDEIINAAVLAHRNWVTQFKSAIEGFESEKFDVARAFDDKICTLGRWLLADAKNVIGAEQYAEIVSSHKDFHEIAGQIARMINQRADADEIASMLSAFDNLSKDLIRLLLAAKY